MAKSKKGAKKAGGFSFEASMQDLEKIVQELESGELSLEDSLASFERGVDLFRRCRDYLEAAKQKVEVLLGEDAQGQPIVEAYEEDLDEDDEEETE